MTVIEAGPATIRRLDRGAPVVPDELIEAALEALDDPVALLADQPVSVDALWETALRTLLTSEPAVIVVPTGWSAARTARVKAAAGTGRLVTRAVALSGTRPAVVVEIGPRLVVVSGARVDALPRTGDPQRVAAATARRVLALAPRTRIILDAPRGVGGATVLAGLIAERLRAADLTIDVVDGLDGLSRPGTRRREPPSRRHRMWLAAAVLPIGLCWLARPPAAPVADPMPSTTVLLEGQIAVQVPAQWPVRRITAGPGSARVVLTSPSDPRLALHVTQSPGDTVAAVAATIERALAEQPPGVFVDFAPAAGSAGRPALTYREIRPGHDIRWSIVLDGAVRIGIGCQSPPGSGEDVIGEICRQAVRSAHSVR